MNCLKNVLIQATKRSSKIGLNTGFLHVKCVTSVHKALNSENKFGF